MKFYYPSLKLLTLICVWAISRNAISKTTQNSKVFDYLEFSTFFDKKSNVEEVLAQFQQMERLRSSAEASLQSILSKNPKNIEIQLRLGELFLQKARDFEQYSLELESFGETAKAKLAHAQIKPLYKMGLQIQEALLPRLSGHLLEASVYFGIARTYASLGQKVKALEITQKGLSIKRATKDVLLQLWMLRGDLAFSLSRGSEAAVAYSKASEFVAQASLDDLYISYRRAWTEYNLKNAKGALTFMKKVVEDRRNRHQIKEEAIKDYALFCTDLSPSEVEAEGGIPGIYAFLSRNSSDSQAHEAISYLGKVLFKNGHRLKAVQAYEFLLREDIHHPENGSIALTIVEWSKSLSDQLEMKDRFVWLLNHYGPQSAWYEAQASKPDIQKNSADAIEKSLREHAIALHRELAKESSKERREMTYDVLAVLYDAHIKVFSSVPRVYYYRAEIYRDMHAYADAGRSYDKFLIVYKPLLENGKAEQVDTKLALEAARGSVEVWAKALEKSRDHVDSFLNSADYFLANYPKHHIAVEVAFDAAKVSLKNNQSTQALNRIHYLVENFPKTKQSHEAVHAALDILNNENDFTNLAIKARLWIDSINSWAQADQVANLKSELSSILEKTELKACEQLGKDKERLLESALCFQKYGRGFKGSDSAPQALALSAEIFEKAADSRSALDALRELVDHYPNSKQASSAFAKLAVAYEKKFDFKESASIYEKLLQRSDTQDRAKLLARLLWVLQGLGDDRRLSKWMAHKEVSDQLRKEVKSKEYFEKIMMLKVLERQHGTQLHAKLDPEILGVMRELHVARANNELSLDLDLELYRFEGLMEKSKGNISLADKLWSKGLKTFWEVKNKTPADWESAARLRLTQASYWRHQFDEVKLSHNAQKKLELYQKLEAWYAEVINMKSPAVALEALWETSKLYRSFSKELKSLPQTKTQGEEMEVSAAQLLVKVAESARKWKVFSPVLVAAIQEQTANNSSRTAEQWQFPWPDLPPFVELSHEELAWTEWTDSNESLMSRLKSKKTTRSEIRKALFVLLFRNPALSNPIASEWMYLLNDKNGVRLRIQALVKENNTRSVELFLNQYEEIFGIDSFYSFYLAQNAWSRGDYSSAYKLWSESGDRYKDFASVYMASGWSVLLEKLTEAKLSVTSSDSVFKKLLSVSDDLWKKHYLSYLCASKELQCSESSEVNNLLNSLKMPNPSYLITEIEQNRSPQYVQHRALEKLADLKINAMVSMKEAPGLREIINDLKFFVYKTHGKRRSEAFNEYQRLKAKLSSTEIRLTNEEEDRSVASSKGGGV